MAHVLVCWHAGAVSIRGTMVKRVYRSRRHLRNRLGAGADAQRYKQVRSPYGAAVLLQPVQCSEGDLGLMEWTHNT